MSEQVGPVIVSHPLVRSILESSGVCFSFRTSDRTTGRTHYRYERTGQKQADVIISRVSDEMLPTADNLSPYRQLSGFESTGDWCRAIKDIHGDLETKGHVYRIEVVASDG